MMITGEQPESTLQQQPDIDRMIRSQVGRQGLATLIDTVRNTMYAEALRISKGNKSVAAKLLGVDRRCVQRMAAQLQLVVSEAPAAPATAAAAQG